MLLFIIVLVFLSYFVATKLQKIISKPILDLANATKKISKGTNYSLRVQKKGRDEIGVLYDSFNNMMDQIHLREQERDKATDSLQRSEELNSSITQSAADAIISINSDGIILAWNYAAEKIFGYSSSEMVNKDLAVIMPAQYRTDHRAGIKRLKNGGKAKLFGRKIELIALRKDGTEFPVELSLSRWEAKNEKYSMGIIRDITERKQAEKELAKHREHLEDLVKDRTAELEEKNAELKHFNKLFVGREFRIKELRNKVKELEKIQINNFAASCGD